MKLHTTFKIGGNADILALPSCIDDIISLLKTAQEYCIPVFLMGNGSNLLVRDKGIRGLVIKLGSNFCDIEINDHQITAAAGISMSALAQTAMKAELAGIEFLSGIPGTLGGGVYMNAGAYGFEIKDVLQSVAVLTEQLNIEIYEKENLQFGYRHSCFTNKKMVILSATLALRHDKRKYIEQRMKDFNNARKEKQPLNMPSAGSVFKRPPNAFAAALIDKAGLKGYSIGGAQVSSKHAGFIVNTGNATAEDVLQLINVIKEKISTENGISLETEVLVYGEE